MPGVHSGGSEMIHLSRLSPDIPRIDILEQEEPEGQMANNLFDMFGSQFSSSSGGTGASFNSSSTRDKSVYPEISAFPEQTSIPTAKVNNEVGHLQAAAAREHSEHGFDSFQFFTRSMFEDKEKELLEQQSELMDSRAPVTKLWTEYEPHYSDNGTQQQHNSYEHHPADKTNANKNGATLKPSWGAGVSTSSAALEPTTTTTTASKPKRKRSRPCKSSEEVESQRMTHIAVERNRRKQMNEHLRVLRSLMPGSYVHRGDQASIIGGAIEFVKELQQLLQCLEEQKKRKLAFLDSSSPARILGAVQQQNLQYMGYKPAPLPQEVKYFNALSLEPAREFYGEAKSDVAGVEVKIVDSNGFIKILCQRKSGQLLKTMMALEQNLFCSIVHTNVTTIEQTVLYSFEVRIGPECTLAAAAAADDIAAFIHDTLAMTHNSE